MTLLDEIFGSDKLRAADIKRPIEVVIGEIEPVSYDDGPKLLISFEGCEKRLVCNKTNALTIGRAYGQKLEDWTGRPVILDVHDTPMGPGIQVKIPVKAEPVFVPENEGNPF